MTVDLDGGTGLFDRLGRMGHLLNLINSRFGGSSANDFPVELNDIMEEFDAESDNDIRAAVDKLLSEFSSFQSSPAQFRSALVSAARVTLIEMVDADDPLPSRNVSSAIDVLVRQMNDAVTAETVDASEPTISSLVDGPRTGTITGATQANPVVITDATHGLSDGDLIAISGVVGQTEINDRQFTVNVLTANTFELIGEDGTGHTAYTMDGKWHACYGCGDLILSVLDGEGKTLENLLAEDLILKIDDTDTAGSESGVILGEAKISGTKTDHTWPTGSGSRNTITVGNPTNDGAWLTNGDFEAFTVADTPDDWTIDTGAAATDILEENTNYYRGTSSLEFVGDGATLIAISQDLSALSLASRTPYPLSVQTMVDVVPAAGTLIIDLYDGSAVITDDEGTANSLTIDLTSEYTVFQRRKAVFRLPEPIPAIVKVRVRLSAAISVGSSAFLDDIYLGTAMTQLYTAGPYVSLVRGAVDQALDDQFKVTAVNARDGAFQELFDKFFNTPEKPLPSATGGSETISDGLIG